jgi:hypothetical protein
MGYSQIFPFIGVSVESSVSGQKSPGYPPALLVLFVPLFLIIGFSTG